MHNKGRRAQIFSFDPDWEWYLGRMCWKIWPTFDCLQGSTAILCCACALSFCAANYQFFLSLSFVWQIHICVPNLNVICSTVHFKDQENRFWSIWLSRALDPRLNSVNSIEVNWCNRYSYTDDAIILLNFIFTGLHGYQITPSLSTNKQRHRLLLSKTGIPVAPTHL